MITTGLSWGMGENAYEDFLSITADTIEYRYKPVCFNPASPRWWKYQSDSPKFRQAFETLETMMLDFLNSRRPNIYLEDGPMFDIQVELNDYPDQIREFTDFSLEKSKPDEFSIPKFLTPELELSMAVTDLFGPEPEIEEDNEGKSWKRMTKKRKTMNNSIMARERS